MTVIKGCEGTYLRLNDKDHEICNETLLDKYEDGTVVEASIERNDNCVSDRIRCAMPHNHECEPGTFKIIKIK